MSREEHYTKHSNDQPQPEGMQNVRVDGGNSKTPPDQRVYVWVKAGYGEGRRASRVRLSAQKEEPLPITEPEGYSGDLTPSEVCLSLPTSRAGHPGKERESHVSP